MSEFDNILRRAIGQGTLGLGPNEFVRVEFRSIGWEELNIQSPLLAQEVLDDEALVDGASIPKQHHRSPQVPEQIAQEFHDLHARDVGAVETEIESKPPPTGRDGESGDGGDPIMPVAVSEDRGLPNRSPGLADIRHEEEAAFVEKGEMGPKSSSFFLYLATSLLSTGRWLARPVVWHGVPASAMSIVDSPLLARHGPGGSESQSASESVSLCAVGSTDPLSSRPPEARVSKAATTPVADRATIGAAVLAQAWAAERLLHRPGSSEPSALPSLWTHSESRPRIGRSCQLEVRRWPGVCVPPVVEEFHRVSCSIR